MKDFPPDQIASLKDLKKFLQFYVGSEYGIFIDQNGIINVVLKREVYSELRDNIKKRLAPGCEVKIMPESFKSWIRETLSSFRFPRAFEIARFIAFLLPESILAWSYARAVALAALRQGIEKEKSGVLLTCEVGNTLGLSVEQMFEVYEQQKERLLYDEA